MHMLLIGLGLISAMISLFWLKDTWQKPWLVRLAYSELVARVTVIGGAMFVIGLLQVIF